MALSKFIKEANRYSEKISLFHVIILSCFFALISIINHHGGTLHIETDVRLPFYLSDVPLLNKLFDSQIIEGDRFRARELSYVLDFIDSKFIEYSIENGFPHFLSLMHYLFSIATGCLLWLFCVKELRLKPLTGVGLFVLFWTSPGIFLGGIYFRAAKVGVAFLAVVLFYVIYKVVIISGEKPDSRISKRIWLWYCAAIFLITFLDEQGLFFAFVVTVFLTIWGLVFHNRNMYIMLLIATVSILLHLLYRYTIAPQLTFLLNGYWPNFDYQILPVQTLIKSINYYILAGFYLYLEVFRYLTGTPPQIVSIGLLLIFIIAPFFYLYANPATDNDKKFFFWALIELIILNFFLIIMNAIMFLKSPVISWPDIRRTYYFLPMDVIFIMILSLLAGFFYKSNITRWLVSIMICLAIIGNITALPKHEDIIRQANMSYIQASSDLLKALKKINSLDNVRDSLSRQTLVFKFFKSKKENPPAVYEEYNIKGIYYAEHGQYRKAYDNFSKAISQNPDDIRFRISRAYLNFKLLKYERAIEDLNEVISRKPDYAEAYSNRGFAYVNIGNKELGCRDAQKACALGNCILLEKARREGFCL